MRLFESYPYELLLDRNCHLVENSLCFVTEVSLACKNGAAIYYMVNRASPGIIVLLNSLMENQQLFSINSINQEVYRAAVTLIYFITRYNYVKFNEREFNFLVSRVKANMLDGLTHS